jgi:hypothetical protein
MNNPSARRLSAAARARYSLTEHGPWPLLALALVVADAAAGAALHYGAIPFRVHLAFSVLTVAINAVAGIQAILRNLDAPPVRRAAMLVLSFTFSQVLLGVGSYMNLLVAGTLEWFPIAHTAVGIALFASAVALAVLVYRRIHPQDAELAQGGVAIA